MSRQSQKNFIDPNFIARFVEICGSSEPARIRRLLNISYQAAKNYLNGRVPEPGVLIALSRKTNCSIHWLLTGDGVKYIGQTGDLNTPPLAREMEASIRRICVEVINEMLERNQTTQSKIVVLPSDKLLSEKATEETSAVPENQS